MVNIYLCEDSLEGVFTGIYEALKNKETADGSKIIAGEVDNYELFANYITVVPKESHTKEISKLIYKRLGNEGYMDICRALASEDTDKADAVYHTVVWGKSMGNLADSHVRKVFELSRSANNELLHLLGFLRFSELENGILFARIAPKNNILSFIAPHFSDRLPLENFVIYDERRKLFVVHPISKEWILVVGENLDEEMVKKFSEKEEKYRDMFCHFCKTIGIESRKNLRLQRQMLPIRFREYMPEKNIDFSL